MDLQQLRYVVEVADTSSFTRAAERCFVTQSALSHQIAALEREIGHRLFLRSSRTVRLTEQGAAFLVHARVAVRAAAEAREAAAAAAGEVRGVLRLGMIPTVTAVNVPLVIARYRARHPLARIELVVGNSDSLVRAVRDGRSDAALLGLRLGAAPQGVEHRELLRERLVVVLPADHPFAERSSLRLADLVGEVFADFPDGTSGRAQSDAAFAAADLDRDVAFAADSAELLIGLVAAGVAVTLLAPGVVAGSGHRVRLVPLSDGPIRVEYLAWDGRVSRSVTTAFRELIEEITSEREAASGNAKAGPEMISEPAPSAL